MQQFNVTGMSCAACSARVEKAVNGLDGVTSCSVSLLTNSMGVEGTASAADIIAAVENAGYGCKEKGAGNTAAPSMADAAEALEDHETPKLKKEKTYNFTGIPDCPYVFLNGTQYVGMAGTTVFRQPCVKRYHSVVTCRNCNGNK